MPDDVVDTDEECGLCAAGIQNVVLCTCSLYRQTILYSYCTTTVVCTLSVFYETNANIRAYHFYGTWRI